MIQMLKGVNRLRSQPSDFTTVFPLPSVSSYVSPGIDPIQKGTTATGVPSERYRQHKINDLSTF